MDTKANLLSDIGRELRNTFDGYLAKCYEFYKVHAIILVSWLSISASKAKKDPSWSILWKGDLKFWCKVTLIVQKGQSEFTIRNKDINT